MVPVANRSHAVLALALLVQTAGWTLPVRPPAGGAQRRRRCAVVGCHNPRGDSHARALRWSKIRNGGAISVSPHLVGTPVDEALAEMFPPLSKAYFGELCNRGRVAINGALVARSEAPLNGGDVIEVKVCAAEGLPVNGEEFGGRPLDVLFEDSDFIAIDKPPGMVCHPSARHWNQTFVNALIHHTTRWPHRHHTLPDPDGDGLRYGIVHRLDQNTTGVLLGAKTYTAQRALMEAFARRQTCKIYLAIVCGVPGPITCVYEAVDAKRLDRSRRAITRSSDGKPALSMVHQLATNGIISLVAVRIYTGRTHQIRLHARRMRCPIAGDPKYGDRKWDWRHPPWHPHRARRTLLHALQLRLNHPVTREALRFHAPPPADLASIGAELAGCSIDEFEAWLAPRIERVAASSLTDLLETEGSRIFAPCSLDDILSQLKKRQERQVGRGDVK